MATTKQLLDRFDSIVFEAGAALDWIAQLRKRAVVVEGRLSKLNVDDLALKEELKELREALKALGDAEKELEVFEAYVAKRGGGE